MLEQLVVDSAPDMRAEFFIEEVLELEGALPLGRILGVERRLRPALLDRGDDSGRVPDRLPVESENGSRHPTAKAFRGQRVENWEEGAPSVGDPLEVQRPADLLVVVRDLELPEDDPPVGFRLVSQSPSSL